MNLLISILLLSSAPDSLGVVERSEMRQRSLVQMAENTPSAALLSHFDSFTSAEASADGHSERKPLLREEGDGHIEGRLDIATLIRTDSLSTVSGNVKYSNGIRRGVLWNSSSDYRLIYPYAVADSVGGYLRNELYSFTGGYAFRRGLWHFGLSGSYRALQEWRETDPRPRNIVSDLTASASAGKRVGGGYIIDFSASYRRYSQSNDVEFYNPRGANSSVFHLTGLGSHYARFAGTNSSTTYTRYAGNGAGFAVNLLPVSQKGWYASLAYDMLDIIHYLPSQNESPYQESVSRKVSLKGERVAGSWKAGAYAKAGFRNGLEYVLDNGSAGLVQTLMRFAMFSAVDYEAGLDAALLAGGWRFDANAAFKGFHAQHNYPGRLLQTSGINASAGATRTLRSRLWFISAQLGAKAYVPFGAEMILPEQYTMPALMDHYETRLQRLQTMVFGADAGLHAERQVTRGMSAFVSAGIYYDSIQSAIYRVTIGLNFL